MTPDTYTMSDIEIAASDIATLLERERPGDAYVIRTILTNLRQTKEHLWEALKLNPGEHEPTIPLPPKFEIPSPFGAEESNGSLESLKRALEQAKEMAAKFGREAFEAKLPPVKTSFYSYLIAHLYFTQRTARIWELRAMLLKADNESRKNLSLSEAAALAERVSQYGEELKFWNAPDDFEFTETSAIIGAPQRPTMPCTVPAKADR